MRRAAPRLGGLLTLVALAAAGYALHTGRLQVPDAWNPWAPLDVHAPLNMLTGYKLSRLDDDRAQCLATLNQAQARYTPLADRTNEQGCAFHNVVRLTEANVRFSAPLTLSCRSAVALALWTHHVLQPAAEAHFGQAVSRLDHYGSYACRNVYGRTDAPLSRHATADAVDIAAFVLADGRRIDVRSAWASATAPEGGVFLRTVRDGACRVFEGVLSPDYNEAHRDHLHFDRGGYRVCR